MKRLSYRTVFSKYSLSCSDQLARIAYSSYKAIRITFSKWFPLKDHERWHFEDHYFKDSSSCDMPSGVNLLTKKPEDGFLSLKYIDFFDYLPKEDLDAFKKALRKFVRKNSITPYGSFRTAKDEDRIDNMGRYVDRQAFSNLHTVRLTHNKYLEQHISQVSVSLRNLSSSFLVVKYRFYLNNNFNKHFNSICRTKFYPYTDICRRFDIPWYKPWKFGKAIHTGNDARQKELYTLISELKWKALKELECYFPIYFSKNHLFPPTFETYATNIRPDNAKENQGFWDSVMLESHPDYAPRYNACVCWNYHCSSYEGIKLSAYCGGNYSESSSLPEIAQYELSNTYAVYMTASSIRRIAERDIAIYNKRISKAIRKSRTSLVLKVRVNVERALYHSYRFISEFTGDTIDFDDIHEFKNHFYKDSSTTLSCLKGISENIAETKKQIDTFLRILDDAAEYGSSKSNMNLQLSMMIITILSLCVAIIAFFNGEHFNFISFCEKVFALFQHK